MDTDKVADAIEKALEPYKRRIKELEEELAWTQHELEECKKQS